MAWLSQLMEYPNPLPLLFESLTAIQKTPTEYVVRNSGHELGQAQTYGWVKPVNVSSQPTTFNKLDLQLQYLYEQTN